MDKKINDIAREFRRYLLENFEWQKDAAEYFDCSEAMISAVGRGRKQPTATMLEAMGAKKEKKTVYYYSKK